MKKAFIILGCILLIGKFTFAQADSVLPIKLVKKISENIVDFTTDNLGNMYLVKNNNQLKKVNSQGDSLAIYNDVKRYGVIHSIDVTNPLKILVFYKDFATVVVLDRFLNVRNIIDLRRQQIFWVQAVATSYDNNIWVFDDLNSKLKKLDDMGKVLFETSDFRQVFEKVPRPQVMFDRDGQLYMYDSARGVLVFDYYGAYKNTHSLLQIKDIQVLDKNTITGRDSSHLILYKPATFTTNHFTAFKNQSLYKKIIFAGNVLYALQNNGELELYQLK